jgi:hypothetical protein
MGVVITRREQEFVYVGPDISVKVVTIVGGQVKLLVSAPPHVRICREKPDYEPPPCLKVGVLPVARSEKHHPDCGQRES